MFQCCSLETSHPRLLFFTALNFTFTTRHIHNWMSFLLWPYCFFLSGATSNCPLLCPSSTLDTFWLRGLSSIFISFSFFILFRGLSQQEYWRGLSFPPPVDHILSELFAMTHPSWMALQNMTNRLIELHKPLRHDKAVIHEGDTICMVWDNLLFKTYMQKYANTILHYI